MPKSNIEPKGAMPAKGQPGPGEAIDTSKVDRMGTGSIGKLMLEFSIPAIAANILNSAYNLIDAIFLGNAVGQNGLAATTVAFPTMMVLMSLGMLVGVGGNALAAIRLGQKKREDAEKVLGNSVTLLMLFGILVALIGMFAIDPLLRITGATDTVLPYARTFLRIVCFGFILQNVGFGINNFIRTAGAPNRALLTMAIGTVACIILNYLFVMVLGMGVAGSALATVLGQGVSAVFVISYFLGNKAPFKLRRKYLKLDPEIAPEILKLGVAPFVMQAANAIVNVILNLMLVKYGAMVPALGSDGALAAIGVVGKITMFAVMPIIGISTAAQPIEGYNYGARNYGRVKKTLKIGVVSALIVTTFFFVLIHLIPNQLVGMFGVSATYTDFAVEALIIYTYAIPLIAPQMLCSNYFQATGQPLKSAILALTRQIIYLLPLVLVLPVYLPQVFPQLNGITALCFCMPISDTLSFITAMIFIAVEMRRVNKLQRELDAERPTALAGGTA